MWVVTSGAEFRQSVFLHKPDLLAFSSLLSARTIPGSWKMVFLVHQVEQMSHL